MCQIIAGRGIVLRRLEPGMDLTMTQVAYRNQVELSVVPAVFQQDYMVPSFGRIPANKANGMRV